MSLDVERLGLYDGDQENVADDPLPHSLHFRGQRRKSDGICFFPGLVQHCGGGGETFIRWLACSEATQSCSLAQSNFVLYSKICTLVSVFLFPYLFSLL